MSMLAIGNFGFSMNTVAYSTITNRDAHALPRLDLIGARPILQDLGPAFSERTISGTCYPLAMNPQRDWPLELGEMLGKSYPVVTGTGSAWPGKWTLKELEIQKTNFLDNGAPRKLSFTMILERSQ